MGYLIGLLGVIGFLGASALVAGVLMARRGARESRQAAAAELALREQVDAAAVTTSQQVRLNHLAIRLLGCLDRPSICTETLLEVQGIVGPVAPAVLAISNAGLLEPVAFSGGANRFALKAFAGLDPLDIDTREALAIGTPTFTVGGVLVVPFGDSTGASGAVCVVAAVDSETIDLLGLVAHLAGAALEACRRRDTTGSIDIRQLPSRTRRTTRPLAASDIQRGLLAGEFACHYQPLVSLADRRLTGFESLARWHHPRRGLLLPERFLGVAEDTGLIIAMGETLMEEAAAEAASWKNPQLAVSVNLSTPQLMHTSLVPMVADTLRRHGLERGQLVIEVTEAAVLSDTRRAATVMAELRALGVLISLDDFGTGYSSLSWLLDCAADTIKVDKAFVATIDARDERSPVTDAVLALAHALGLEVVAEGIESEAQLRRLKLAGCSRGQGWLFGRPMDRAAASAAAASWPRRTVEPELASGGTFRQPGITSVGSTS